MLVIVGLFLTGIGLIIALFCSVSPFNFVIPFLLLEVVEIVVLVLLATSG